MLPKNPGANKVSMKENLSELSAIVNKVAKASPHILSLGTPKALLNFYIKDHKSDTYIWNDAKGNSVAFFSVINPPNENAMEVLSILIDPDFQRQGYGKKIMLFTEKLAHEAGKTKMKLVTNIKNTPAIAFYESIGYAIVKEIKDYYGDGETRYLLEKVL